MNADNTAALTRLIRSLQPAGVTISVGGEIGEVGKENSTEEELRAYLDAYLVLCGTAEPISKVSVQTGIATLESPVGEPGVLRLDALLPIATLQDQVCAWLATAHQETAP